MRAGELDQRVTLERFGEYKDASGAWTEGWETVGTFWAAVLPLTGKEIIAADAVTAITDVRVIMRYQPGVTAADRLKHDGKTFNVVTVINRRSANRELELLCKVAA